MSAFISLALGLIFIGSSDEEVFTDLFSILMSRNDGGKGKIFESPFFVIYILGMGLLNFRESIFRYIYIRYGIIMSRKTKR